MPPCRTPQHAFSQTHNLKYQHRFLTEGENWDLCEVTVYVNKSSFSTVVSSATKVPDNFFLLFFFGGSKELMLFFQYLIDEKCHSVLAIL